MDPNSIISASIVNVSKEYGKKKRSHRSAKLKQCKLDARREQWLSHARNKGCKEEANGVVVGAISERVRVRDEVNKTGQHRIKDLEMRRQRSDVNCEPVHPDSDSESPANSTSNKPEQHRIKDLEMKRQRSDVNCEPVHPDSDSESPANSPSSSVFGGNGVGNSYSGVSSRSSQCSSSSSSFSCGGYGSGSITEDEGGDIGCLDDWEAIADALAAASVRDKPTHNQKYATEKEVLQSGSKRELPDTSKGILGAGGEKPRSDIIATESRPVANCSAWRPDDAFRPHGLPNLSKQNSFPMDAEKHSGRGIDPWGHKPVFPVPKSCPICCEDLDLTDSSFLPCPCGFRLCLFCHKRIVEEDGRCPGCRKTYKLETVEKEASVSGGSLTVRLARSYSLFSRT